MGQSLLFRLLICIFTLGFFLYECIDEQNMITEFKIQIPTLASEVRGIQEGNEQLSYEIEQFESPRHLFELLRKKEFSHLTHPLLEAVIVIEKGA